jgi:D-psicose/D-tagatose/L-ribulose 3-epimerase
VSSFRHYLAIQTRLPDDWKANSECGRTMEVLKRLGFDGVELNIRDPESVDPAGLKSWLDGFGLELSMFASGLTAKTFGLSLASENEELRRESIRRSGNFLAFAAEAGSRGRTGVIAGFLKGTAGETTERHKEILKDSIRRIAPLAEASGTPFIVEAINRFESPLGHSLDEAWDLASAGSSSFVQILPDTFHMNIEEVDMEAAFRKHGVHYASVHLSDNNRFFPGLGAIDFPKVIDQLDRMGYEGKFAIEGNIRRDFIEDVQHSAAYLKPFLEK